MYSGGFVERIFGAMLTMKVTKAQAQANRAHIVETAAALFRERGYDGVGIADLMATAGFTHGGFYKHFASKADLLAEAASCGFAHTAERAEGVDPESFVDYYLSRAHRDAPADGCTMAALCGDASRQSGSVKAVFADGVKSLLNTLNTQADASSNRESAAAEREKNIGIMAQTIGALMLSRACPDDSPLADEILEVCRKTVLAKLAEAG